MPVTMSKMVVACDFGNAIAKLMIVNGKPSTRRIVYPHAVVEASERDFDTAKQRQQDNGLDLFIYRRKAGDIEVNCSYYVGQSAFRSSVVKPLSGALKYTPEYYAPYAMRGLIGLIPNGHDNLHLVAMLPPLDVDYMDNLKRCLGGKHTVTLPSGKTIVYVIREVSVIDEPVGGLYHTLLEHDGTPKDQTLYDKSRVLVIDIGGRVTTMTPATSKGEVDYHRAKGFESGINDIQELFIKEMRHRYPQFAQLRAMNIDQVREALYKGKWDGGGDIIDVSEAKQAACTSFLNDVHKLYKDVGGALSYNHILITGGGGGLLRRELYNDVLNHKSVILADKSYKEMHLANVRGAAKMAIMLKYVKVS